ncbi:dTMP kinase [Lewinellaceae bacterium SD302]|nr:dTMP kinase [Lewinellaceae bacterium SD302]
MEESKSLFIVFEGLDGSGKSTQIDLLQARLEAHGMPCLVTAEPTELPTGRIIRDVIEHRLEAHPQAVAAMFAADRIQHLHEPETGILAELSKGNSVISSRYYFSSLAYQADCADIDWIASLNQRAKDLRPADITFFLDLDPEVSLARITTTREQVDLFENLEKLTVVRAAFKRAFKYWGDKREHIHVIDASKEVGEIAEEIWAIVKEVTSSQEHTRRYKEKE